MHVEAINAEFALIEEDLPGTRSYAIVRRTLDGRIGRVSRGAINFAVDPAGRRAARVWLSAPNRRTYRLIGASWPRKRDVVLDHIWHLPNGASITLEPMVREPGDDRRWFLASQLSEDEAVRRGRVALTAAIRLVQEDLVGRMSDRRELMDAINRTVDTVSDSEVPIEVRRKALRDLKECIDVINRVVEHDTKGANQ